MSNFIFENLVKEKRLLLPHADHKGMMFSWSEHGLLKWNLAYLYWDFLTPLHFKKRHCITQL